MCRNLSSTRGAIRLQVARSICKLPLRGSLILEKMMCNRKLTRDRPKVLFWFYFIVIESEKIFKNWMRHLLSDLSLKNTARHRILLQLEPRPQNKLPLMFPLFLQNWPNASNKSQAKRCRIKAYAVKSIAPPTCRKVPACQTYSMTRPDCD